VRVWRDSGLHSPRLTAVPNGPRVGEDVAWHFSPALKGMSARTQLSRGPLALRLNDAAEGRNQKCAQNNNNLQSSRTMYWHTVGGRRVKQRR
jgi:hypothetical protein